MKTRLSWYALELLSLCFVAAEAPDIFLHDSLSPYDEGWHGSGRSRRDISQCQHVNWNNKTYEEYRIDLLVPQPSFLKYKWYRFEDTVRSQLDNPLSMHRQRYLLGSIAFVENPYHTLSVLEPSEPGGCAMKYFSATRSTVTATSSRRQHGCKLALNAGYFSMTNGQCLGNVVADGRIVQSTVDQNANFGLRQDGTIVVGYIPEEDVLNGSYRQLVTGVIWLVRNGTNYVNESVYLECAAHQNTGKMSTFANVLSARTAIGHDSDGRIVVANIEGQTHRRGANLFEFADILIAHGVINAINLDGGGSSTFLHNQVLVNYPSDHCHGNSAYRCEREVSTILCFHDVQCLEPSCNRHGVCNQGECKCDSPWVGEDCSQLNCSLVQCSHHGNCSNGVCMCDSGWGGHLCEKACSGFYGPGCSSPCRCYGHSVCDPITGACTCPAGYYGFGCWRECDEGLYGVDCKLRCADHNCSGNGRCSPVNGTCLCSANWTGAACNHSVLSNVSPSPTPTVPGDLVLSTEDKRARELSLLSTVSVLDNGVHKSDHSRLYPTQSSIVTANCTQSSSGSYTIVFFVLCIVATASVIVHIFICLKSGRGGGSHSPLPKRRMFKARFWPSESTSDCDI